MMIIAQASFSNNWSMCYNSKAMTMTMTMKYFFIAMKYIIFIQYTNSSHVTITQFSIAEGNASKCTMYKKNVTVLQDNEGKKPWLMGPNLYFRINCCQNRVQRNE